MKTPEEIEKLAKKECVCETGDCVHIKSYIKGYNQCQEDNSDKKYTEEQVRTLVASVTEFMSHNEPEEFDEWFEKKLKNALLIK